MVGQFRQSFGPVVLEKMRVAVHCQGNGGMPYDLLNDLWLY